jgi:phage protein D
MKPDFKIVANGDDITALIRDRFISLVVTDSAGEESDTATIMVDNRDGKIEFPPTGATLDIYMGFVNSLEFKGIYEVDELEEPLDSDTLTISAKAAKMKSSIKAPKSAVYDDITFGEIVAKIATAHDYESSVSPSVGAFSFEHIDQVNESDMSLLTRLARDVGAVLKPVANKLVAVARGESKSVSGQDLPVIEISDPENSTGSISIQERNAYGSVTASYFDEATQKAVVYVTSSASPSFAIAKPFKDEAAAKAAADAMLKEKKRGRSSLTLGRPLTAAAVAEARLVLSNHKPSANGEWLIESATHTIESGSFSASSFRCASV